MLVIRISMMITIFVFNVLRDYSVILFGVKYNIRFYRASGIYNMPRTYSTVMSDTTSNDWQVHLAQLAIVKDLDGFSQQIEVGEGVTGPNKGVPTNDTHLQTGILGHH
jgi:hypothetical protein